MLRQVWSFTTFQFAEYVRSGRIVIELVATVLFWGLFLRQYPVQVEQYFSLAGVLTLLMTLYTSTALLGLGERPQGYVLLTRPLGRSGYLLGLYLVTVIVVCLMFILLTAVTLIYDRFVFQSFGLGGGEIAKGALPLVLNIALLGALMTLLSSLVLTNTWRLVLLAILAIALYSNAWHLWEGVYRFIEPFQSLFSWPVLPAIAGFKLATTRDYSSGGIWIPLAQAALTVLLLSIALSSFRRRDVILKS